MVLKTSRMDLDGIFVQRKKKTHHVKHWLNLAVSDSLIPMTGTSLTSCKNMWKETAIMAVLHRPCLFQCVSETLPTPTATPTLPPLTAAASELRLRYNFCGLIFLCLLTCKW